MGNQVKGQGNNNDKTYTPKKNSNSNGVFSNIFSSNEKQKSKSGIKEGLYAEDKLFENYESK